MLAHGIQVLQCRLSTSFQIFLVKHLEIWLDFLHVRVYVKHGIVPLIIRDIMCTRSPNTFTLPLENWELVQRNFYYVVPCHMSIHIVGAWEIFAWEVRNLLHVNTSPIQPSTLALLRTVTLSFFISLSWLYIHLNSAGPPTLASQGKCTSKCYIPLKHPSGNSFSILHTRTAISFSSFYIIAFETCLAQICL
jgi:hypothetical protein